MREYGEDSFSAKIVSVKKVSQLIYAERISKQDIPPTQALNWWQDESMITGESINASGLKLINWPPKALQALGSWNFSLKFCIGE